MNKNSAKERSTIFVIPGLMLVLAVAIPLMFRDRLPDPVASHWGFSGAPDGNLELWAIVVLGAGLTGLAWLSLVLAHRKGTATRSMVAVVYFIGTLVIGLQVLTVWANLDASSWNSAKHIGFIQVAAIIVVAIGGGALGWMITPQGVLALEERPDSVTPTIDLRPDEEAVWVSKSESKWMPLLAVVVLVAAVVVNGVVGLILLIVAILGVFLSAVRVSANDRGISIGLGWWGWPRRLIPLADISKVEVLDVEPMAYGGWGFRVVGGRSLNGVWALVIRRGPGIRIVRAETTDIVVTVDDAYQGAGLVNDLLSRVR